MKNTILFLLFISIASCSKHHVVTEYLVKEPSKPYNAMDSSSLSITKLNITDHTINISWAVDGVKSLTYDLALNDSVIIYDYTDTKFTYYNLQPESTYNLSIVGYNPKRYFIKIDTTLTTIK